MEIFCIKLKQGPVFIISRIIMFAEIHVSARWRIIHIIVYVAVVWVRRNSLQQHKLISIVSNMLDYF